MKIRVAILQDVKEIAKVHVDSWRTTYAGIVPDQYLKELSYTEKEQLWNQVVPKGNVFVAEKDGQIVGFACGGRASNVNEQKNEGELYTVYLLQKYQGQGIGRKLVNEVANYMINMGINSMVVSVLEENSACKFYEALQAEKMDTVEVDIGGKLLKEAVYRWDNLRKIFS